RTGLNGTKCPPLLMWHRRPRLCRTAFQPPVMNPWSKSAILAADAGHNRGRSCPDDPMNFLIGRCCQRLLFAAALDQLDIDAERLQFANKDVERLGHAGLNRRFTFDDGLINLGAAIDVVGFGGEELLQDVSCAVSLEGPDFHLSEALTTELRLATERLLGN